VKADKRTGEMMMMMMIADRKRKAVLWLFSPNLL
jgi:hypothetical protein